METTNNRRYLKRSYNSSHSSALQALVIAVVIPWLSLPAAIAATLPTDTSGLRLWLKADDLLATQSSGDSLATWGDFSGLGNDASTTGGRTNPTFAVGNLPNVNFNASANELMVAPNLFGGVGSFTDVTIIAVYLTNTNSGDNRPLGFGAFTLGDSTNNFHLATDPSLRFDNGNISSGYSQSHPNNAWFTRSTVMSAADGGFVNEYFDSTQALANSGGNVTPSKDELYLGDLRIANGYNVGVAEVLVYDRALDNAERQALEGYLQSKYYSSAYLRFEEGTPGNITAGGAGNGPTEYTINNHTVSSSGVAGNRPTFSADVPLNVVPLTGSLNNVSLDFERGQVQYLSINHDPSISFGETSSGAGDAKAFTLEAFVKMETLPNGTTASRQYMAFKKEITGVVDNFVDYGVLFRENGLLALQLGNGSTTTVVQSGFEISDFDWHYMSVAFDPTTDLVRFILDDQVQLLSGITFTPLANSSPLVIGAHVNGSGSVDAAFDGLIDEFRLTQGFLDPSQLLNFTQAIPEPSGILLALAGALGIAILTATRRRSRPAACLKSVGSHE